MNKKKSLLLSIIIVLVLGLIITSGSFAYFQWSSGYAAGTGVNVTIEHGGITMHIESEQTEFVGLYPTNNCNNKYAYGDTLVTIKNDTGTVALPSFKLKVRVLKNGDQPLTSNDLKHIHYSVVPIETTKNLFGAPVKGEVIGGYTCGNVPSVNSSDKGGLLSNGTGIVTSSFDFQNVDVNGGWTHLPKVNDKSSSGVATAVGYLPRQYFVGEDSIQSGHNVGDTQAITFKAGTYQTTYQYYRVYVWMDEGYTTTIIGNEVTDPLQNAKIEIQWSENSMVQQVSGESSEQALTPGLYDESGNLTTWAQLIENGDITVEDNVITDSNRYLEGSLVIPEGIVEIGESAFGYYWNNNLNEEIGAGGLLSSVYIPATVTYIGFCAFDHSSLSTITFAPGSQLTTIGTFAFSYTNITSIEIPSTVTYIGESAFGESSLSSITFAPGSQLTTIGYNAFGLSGITSIEIPSAVTSIEEYAFDHSSLSTITFAPGSQLTTIGAYAFSYTNITSIEIPSTVTSIGEFVFDSGSLSSITFMGTVLEWKAIEISYGWNEGFPAVEVVCSDGSVMIREAGLYSGMTLTKTWQQLLTDGDITVVDNVITESKVRLSNMLVIPEGIVEIGMDVFNKTFNSSMITIVYIPSSVEKIDTAAFFGSSLATVMFAHNSQLQIINEGAFADTNLTAITLPNSVTKIGFQALMIDSLDTIKFDGTVSEWNAIEKDSHWNQGVLATEVICSDGEVSL